MERWDAVVLGVGGVGSAALWQLARRGLRVLGLEQARPAHEGGSSHGHTRIIRLAYMEAPEYVPLLQRSFALWEELEREAGVRLYHQVGLLQVGPERGHVVGGADRSAARHGLRLERPSLDEARARWPGFAFEEGQAVAFDPRAGYLMVERCVAAQVAAAERLGAELRCGVRVQGWRPDGQGVVVETADGPVSAGRLVVCAGAWAGALLAGLGLPLEVRRKTLLWFPPGPDTTREGCPCFLFERPEGIFYGFPDVEGRGLKAAEHSRGWSLRDPDRVEAGLLEGEAERVEAFVRRHLPEVPTPHREHAVCLYTLTPDEHFVVDRHPEHPQVVLAAGLSGHGFKMVPALGQALAELACEGRSGLPLGYLGLDRPGLRQQGCGPIGPSEGWL